MPPQRRFNFLKRLNDPLSMGPRKKTKPNGNSSTNDAKIQQAPASNSRTDPPTTAAATGTPTESEVSPPKSAQPTAANTSEDTRTQHTARVKKSWYGSWKSKAAPIAQVAKESIGVTGGSTTELPAEGSRESGTDSPKKLLTKRRSSKGNPIAASITQVNATSSKTQLGVESPEDAIVDEAKLDVPEPPLPPDPTKAQDRAATETNRDGEEKEAQADRTAQAPGVTSWRYWWSRPDGYNGNTVKGKPELEPEDTALKEAQTTPLPGATPTEEPTKSLSDDVSPPTEEPQQKPASTNAADGAGQTKSWFWLWSNTQNAQGSPQPQDHKPDVPQETQAEVSPQVIQAEPTADPTPKPIEALAAQETDPKPLQAPAGTSKASGWAFWSRSTPPQPNEPPGTTQKEVGELAVADTPSQSHPEAAQFNQQEEPVVKEPPVQEVPKTPRGRTRTKDTSSKPSTPAKGTPKVSPTRKAGEVKKVKQPEPSSKPQQPENILLPDFRSTYRLVQTSSIWKQLRKYFLGGEPEAPHLYIEPNSPKIKKAIAIGVHGYFPAPFIQKFIGQPTGTSIRFANAAAASINEWTESRGYTCEVEKVALEGEGFIADRVTMLWKLLLNWVDHIKEADFILVACHSQGVPVAIQLIAKLVQFGLLNNPRIGICAMAGVNLGPFAEYKPRFFAGSASELFEFSRPQSTVSQDYMKALEEILKYGVKLVYVGSIDDQLVSLESSTFSNISHPYIYRAVFVDGRIHAPDL